MEERIKISKIIPVDIYRRDVLLVVNYSHKDLAEELLKYISKGEVKRTMKECRSIQRDGAITVLHGNGGVLVYLPIYHGNESGIAKLTHEMLHAASFIIEETGMSFSHHTQEAYAHLLEYLMGEAMKALNQIK
ncbi:MAG: hypothetical protein Q4A64_03305 [Porphyromonadaceae bacterium]|nr:hypothetical protein [Porphyromonadaceae bacterium]